MSEITAQEHIEKLNEMLETISESKMTILEHFSNELIIAADVVETIKVLDDVANDLKQLRGKVIEYIV